MSTTKNCDTVTKFKSLKSPDYIKITMLGFALATLSSSLHAVILPVRILDFATESVKSTYLGLLTSAGLLVAMIVQPLAGAISDRSGFKWGRRRPFILLGTLITLPFLAGVGYTNTFVSILAIWCLLQASINIAQGPYQAFIPDLVATDKRGTASGVKTLLEILGGIALIYPIAFFTDRYSYTGTDLWLWLALGIVGIVLVGITVATILMVKEPSMSSIPHSPLIQTLSRTFRIKFKADRDFIWFLASRLFILMSFTTLQTFALYFLRDVTGIDNPAKATAYFSIVAAAGMLIVVYPAGCLSDRVGRLPISIGASLLGALGISLIFLLRYNYPLVMLGSGIIGIAFGAFMCTNWALATDLVAKGEEGRYLGLTNLATAGGAALARLIGPVIDFFNTYQLNFGYSVMLLACFIYFIAGSFLLTRIRKRYKANREI